MAEQLQALTEAYRILDQAAGEVASLASTLPFRCVQDARMYIAAQADELLKPIFQKESN